MNDSMDAYLSSEAILSKISDITRIVDPLQKRVVAYRDQGMVINEIHCFDFWDRNQVCDNCISMRAYHDNTTYIKIEYIKEKVYLITAIPNDSTGRSRVIEIIKDVTNSMFFASDNGSSMEVTDIHTLIDTMNRLAFRDPLTGLYNRQYIIEKLPVDLVSAALLSTELAIIMADIDYFKAVNDNYGHLAGDQALKDLAATLSGCMNRGSDWIARYGGEEFLICMPGTDLETAKATAECMRKSIEDLVIQYEGNKFSVTSSFGVYNLKLSGSETVNDLLKHVDEKLYLAKKNGRNRIEY